MHRSTEELESHLPDIFDAPSDTGTVEMIVRRPAEDQREVVEVGHVDVADGLIGDDWSTRGSASTPDGRSHPEAQITLMNSRVAEAVAGSRERWPLAGDQFYVDMDLSVENLPAGTRLALGDAVIEISAKPHTGCSKFASRYGADALRFANVGTGRTHRFRGVNARVIRSGPVKTGDSVSRI